MLYICDRKLLKHLICTKHRFKQFINHLEIERCLHVVVYVVDSFVISKTVSIRFKCIIRIYNNFIIIV